MSRRGIRHLPTDSESLRDRQAGRRSSRGLINRDRLNLTESFIELLYPRRCVMCDEVLPYGGAAVCGRHGKLPYVKPPCCMRCGKEVESEETEYCLDCERHVRSFDRGFPVFNYEEPVKSSVLAIKYHNKQEYCDFYGAQMAEKVRPYVKRYGIDGVAYVPVHRKKLRARGFNQAYVLAKRVAEALELPVMKDALIRKNYTAPQKELDNVQRANNIKESMAVGRIYPECRNVLLVDDIFTTGVTIDVCAGLLREAGAQHVYCSTICVGKGR